MFSFGSSSARIIRLREKLLDIKPSVCVQRAQIATEVYKNNESRPVVIKRAVMLKEVLERMDIYIEDDTLIVGNQASSNRAAPIFPEYAMDWVIDELDEFDRRSGDRFLISEENKSVLRRIYPYWKGRTLKDKGYAAIPESSSILYDLGIIKAEGNITSGDAHIAVNYKKVLESGIEGFRKMTVQKLDSLDLADYASLKKSYFYKAVLIVLDAVCAFAGRFAKLAMDLACAEHNENRKAELIRIAKTCSRVPEHPSTSFIEAVQSTWFIHLILQIESNGHSLSYGRFDQYIYPYYEEDLKSGTITEEEACEILENLWLKTLTINKIRSLSHTRFSAGSPLYQNVTIGGQTIDGSDGVNELSYMVLKSVARVRLPQPNLTVRYHKGISDDFMKHVIEVIKLGFGMPALNNDEIIIPSFIEKGVAPEDARDYSAIGCVEVAVPGRWGYRCTGMSFLNFPKALMTALNGGYDVSSGRKLVDGVPHFKDMECFEDVMKAWDKTIREFTRHSVIIDSCADMVLEQEVPDILCSALVDDCIQRGLHLKEGGAVYDFISGLQVGIANLADSLASLKKLVYEDKKIGRAELWDALVSNFEGPGGRRIRQLLVNNPHRYGNDDDYVDSLLVKAYGSYIDEISKYKNTRYGRGPIGGRYYAGTSSISANVPQGSVVGATPDGRHAGRPLAEGCSPCHGADITGPTAVFKSVAKLPTKEITGGVLLNQRLTPQVLKNDRDIEKFILLLRTFFDRLKGFHVQYNMVSTETLLDAQKHPEKYRDLIVRVAGYSAFFNVLSKETQDDIIERTQHTL